jgi:hypothetical protein
VLLLTTPASAFGQTIWPAPTDNDMRAAYCQPVVRYLRSYVEGFPEPPAEAVARDPGVAKEEANIRGMKLRLKTDDDRLSLYIAMRLGVVDPIELSLALARGKDDVEKLKGEMSNHACSGGTPAENSECGETFVEQSGIGSRIARCRDLSWLPF